MWEVASVCVCMPVSMQVVVGVGVDAFTYMVH